MTPTLEQIIANLQRTMPLVRRQAVVEAAKSIEALFNPVRKPLSELANSEEDCRELADMISFQYEGHRMNKEYNAVEIWGEVNTFQNGHLFIYPDGDVIFNINQVTEHLGYPFVIVDWIRSKGYDVTPETK
jgi:hypothetical protein